MSKKTLILTEKPSVARDFASALSVKTTQGKQGYYESESYVITWAIGHLMTPYDPEDYDSSLKKWSISTLPILPERFAYRPNIKTKKQLSVVKKQLSRKDISNIYVATDAGREGELIARIILAYAKVKNNCWRFWTSQALNKSVILNELSKQTPLSNYDRLFFAGRARQMADWFVGMNLSRLATLKLGDLFSVGRVQTAVLALLVERRNEIEKFNAEPYWTLNANCSFSAGSLKCIYTDILKRENSTHLSKKPINLEEELKGKEILISKATKKDKVQPPPMLFSLTELQRLANSRYGLTAKRTLEIAQALYEKHKCLSYPRSDSEVLGTENLDMAKSILAKLSQAYVEYSRKIDPTKISLRNRRVFNDSKLTDHHALVPLKRGPKNLSGDELKVFILIVKRFFMVFSNDYKTIESSIILKSGKHYFRAKGKQVSQLGWRHLDINEKEVTLPNLKEGDSGTIDKIQINEKQTQPPPEYSENLLLKDMTNPARLVKDQEFKKLFRGQVGLGTQATRAQIIETLIKRNYISRIKKSLVATDKGQTLIRRLKSLTMSKALTSPEETAKWEIKLDQISQNKGSFEGFISEIKNFINNATDEWKALETIESKNRFTKNKYSKYKKSNNNNSTSKEIQVISKCPFCNGKVIVGAKAYGCDRWKEGCSFTVWKTIASKKISQNFVKELIKNGKSDIHNDWKSKAGNNFSASLRLDNEKKSTLFDFVN